MTSQINSLRKRLREFKNKSITLTLDDVFQYLPDGDFVDDDSDAGEWQPWYCDDCHTYHEICYAWTYERKNGKKNIYRYSIDQDGNKELEDAWTDGENSTDVLTIMQNEINEYFKAWAEYYLYCAETGYAPLEKRKMSMVEAIKAAQENINYLYMGSEK